MNGVVTIERNDGTTVGFLWRLDYDKYKVTVIGSDKTMEFSGNQPVKNGWQAWCKFVADHYNENIRCN